MHAQAPGTLFTSDWPLKDGSKAYTIVNRAEARMNYTGPAILVGSDDRDNSGLHFYDLYHGVEVVPQGGAIHLSVEAAGFGAVLASEGNPS